MITRDSIRGDVSQRDNYYVGRVSLHLEGELRGVDEASCIRHVEMMRSGILEKIYGAANRAVSELEYAVTTSLLLDANRDGIVELFRKLRSTIPVE